jgi:hypothetical protein
MVASLLLLLAPASFIFSVAPKTIAQSLSQSDLDAIYDWPNWVPTTAATPPECTTTTPPTTDANSNLDYAGRPILDQGQLASIAQYKSIYEQAADQANIPWEMLAAVHYREDSLKLVNPPNDEGVYQIVNATSIHPDQPNLYAPGPINSQQFLQETIDSANFIQSKVSSNDTGDQTLTTSTTDTNTIKDTFFGYNGRAPAYIKQAAQNGFDPNTQGFEGSSYVMNKADAKRDAAALPPNETTWGWLPDGKTMTYPSMGSVDEQYGAFVVYADLAMINPGQSCDGSTGATGPLEQQVVTIATEEYTAWQSGTQDPKKYTNGKSENWCAAFVSWVYNKANYPLMTGGGSNWLVEWVPEFVPSSIQQQDKEVGLSIEASGRFVWHDEANNSYTPQPGDIAVHNISGEPLLSHVNIVVGVSGNQASFIGGNEPGVQQDTYSFDGRPPGDTIIGYASPQ